MQGVNILSGEVVEVPDGIFTYFVRPLPKGDARDPSSITVQEHLDTREQIEEMITFGQRLADRRAASYGSDLLQEGEGDDAIEPGVAQGADLVDVQRSAAAVGARLRSQQDAAASAAAAKAKAEAEAADKARIDAAVAAKLAAMGE